MSEQTQKPATHLVLSVEDAQLILNYLSTKPYVEVAKLVNAMATANLVNLASQGQQEAPASEESSGQA
jgi:hypothetical protein